MRNTIFCKPSDTQIDLRINNQIQKPKKIPLLVNNRIVYLTRYAEFPIIGMWHSNPIDTLKPITVDTSTMSNYEILNNSGHLEIKSIGCSTNNGHTMRIHFSPSIPDLRSLKSNIEIDGRFSISCDSINGIIGGDYKISKSDKHIAFLCQPTKGFQPNPGKAWVKTLTFQADCVYNEQYNTMEISSKWIKK